MKNKEPIVMKFGLQLGETVSVDSHTAPTKSGFCRVTGKIIELLPSGRFILDKGDPYFGYTIFDKSDLLIS